MTSIHSFQDFTEVPGDVLAAEFYDQRSQLMRSLSRRPARVTDQKGGRPAPSPTAISPNEVMWHLDTAHLVTDARGVENIAAARSGSNVEGRDERLESLVESVVASIFCGVCRGAIRRPTPGVGE